MDQHQKDEEKCYESITAKVLQRLQRLHDEPSTQKGTGGTHNQLKSVA